MAMQVPAMFTKAPPSCYVATVGGTTVTVEMLLQPGVLHGYERRWYAFIGSPGTDIGTHHIDSRRLATVMAEVMLAAAAVAMFAWLRSV